MLDNGRLSFDALQRRLVTSPGKAHELVASTPASYVAFDLLAVGGVDLRSQRWTNRRRRLESLAAWTPPLQLSLVTDDPSVLVNNTCRTRRARVPGEHVAAGPCRDIAGQVCVAGERSTRLTHALVRG